MNRWSKKGVLDRVFEQLQRDRIVRIKVEAFGLDSTSVKVHPDGTGARKNGPQSIGKSRGGWNTKIHMVAADARTAVAFTLSSGNAHDAPEGRKLLSALDPNTLDDLNTLEKPADNPAMIMDRAYEDDATLQLVLDLGFVPVVPPKSNRVNPWAYNKELYKRRNEGERLFRRLKGFRPIFTKQAL